MRTKQKYFSCAASATYIVRVWRIDGKVQEDGHNRQARVRVRGVCVTDWTGKQITDLERGRPIPSRKRLTCRNALPRCKNVLYTERSPRVRNRLSFSCAGFFNWPTLDRDRRLCLVRCGMGRGGDTTASLQVSSLFACPVGYTHSWR